MPLGQSSQQSGPTGQDSEREKREGTNLRYFEARDAHAEAEFVAGELERILNDDSDQTCAVEYRTNFQSRSFEEVFRRRGLRYKLVGGFSFYSRAEVKDALAYVRVTLHPEDDISLLRVLNVPPAASARPPSMLCARSPAGGPLVLGRHGISVDQSGVEPRHGSVARVSRIDRATAGKLRHAGAAEFLRYLLG